jgi:perosamine synthetase
MTNMQAALGVAQLERLDEFVGIKRRMGALYTKLLSDTAEIQLPMPKTDYADNIYWIFGLVLADNVAFDAKEAMGRLAKLGIGTRPFFWPMHEQPVFSRRNMFRKEKYPVSEKIARRGFYIPSGMALSEVQLRRSASAVKEILR